MCINKTICVLLFVACIASASAQDTNVDKLDAFSSNLITSIRSHEKQRVFLVTDKSVFSAGEYIWFRAFLINAVSQKMRTKSKFLFVDVVDDKDSIVKRIILDAGNNQFSSHIQFPDSLASGYYWLRAYTKQMAAGYTEGICVKPLYVFDKTDFGNPRKPKKNIGTPDETPQITFYPEGANIMTGINSTVALQAKFKNGVPLSINGYVKDNRDSIIAHFTTNANGLGKFDFEPSGFRQYKAIISWSGKEFNYSLPPFDFYSGQLSVAKQADGYKIRVLLGDSIYEKNAITYVVGISKDSLVFAGIGKGYYEVAIDEKKLPDGIATFYLFDKDFKILSERSVYVQRKGSQFKIETDKTMYAENDKIALSVSIMGPDQNPVPSIVAISVSDSLFSNRQAQCNNDLSFDPPSIDNLFLSTSKCFNEDDIDLMMLTKNNTYKSVLNAKDQSVAYNNDSMLYIKGKVLSAKNESSANKVVMLISNTGNNGGFSADTTDNAGHFYFPIETYQDSTQFGIQVRDLNNHVLNNDILLDTLIYPKLNTPVSLKQYLTIEPRQVKERMNSYYNWQNTSTTLPPVTVKYKKEEFDYDVSKRVSQSSAIITGRALDGRTSLDNLILTVSGLQLLHGFLVIHGLNALSSPSPLSEPLLLVEGVPVALNLDGGIGTPSPILSYLSTLNPKEIDFIEVLKDGNAASYGVRGGNGVILINLLNKPRDFYPGKNSMKMFYAKGVSKPVSFSNVDYTKEKKAAILPDTRSTIFWTGNFFTGDAANTTLNFYTSNIPSTYYITVTGVTINGDLINKTITVRSK